MESTFEGCTNLVTYHGSTGESGDFRNYKIPNSVTDLTFAFSGCSSMKYAPKIHANVKDMTQSFSGSGLVATPDMSGATSVTKLYFAFYNCKNLVTVSNLPANVTDMQYTFSGCTNLKSIPKIPEKVTGYYDMIKNTGVTSIQVPCSCTLAKNKIATHTFTMSYYHKTGCTGSCGK